VKAGNFKAENYKEWTMMAKGGASLAPYYEFSDKIQPDIKAKVGKISDDIKSGAFTVKINDEEPKATY
jgi:basic membrane lipoprotein Med (substrate-binding protein (PBP1-ABC) superfamily)